MNLSKLVEQFAKFGVVGAIAAVIDFSTLIFLTELFGINYLISATVAYCVALVFNYCASMKYVFKHKSEMSRRKEFVIFAVLSTIGLGINNLIMYLCVDFAGINYVLAKVLACAVVMIWNFITRKRFLDATL